MDKKRKGTMLRLTEQDLQAVLIIRQYYGITSDNQAIILAVNLVARQVEEARASSPASQTAEAAIPPAP